MKKFFPLVKIKSIVFLSYFVILFLIQPWQTYWLFILGGLLGLILLVSDELSLNNFYNDTSANLSSKTVTPFLATRSILFLIALVPLSIFIVTSTGSLIGSGLIMGLILGLTVEVWQLHQQTVLFNQRFLTQMKLKLNEQQIMILLTGMCAYFVLLNLLILV